METNQVHVAELCAGLDHGFHYNVQDTDIMTIECEGRKFLCHRAVLAAGSGYFEGMFNNNVWTENVTGTVVLGGDYIKATTLLEILKYLYTGEATITSSNFVDLLLACNYFIVPRLEALCVPIILLNRPKPIVNLLEVLFFAYSVSNQSLIDVLASCNMTARLKKFFRTTEFLDINKDLFMTIVSKCWKSPPILNNVLRRAICRWKVHALKEREENARELYKVLEQASGISLVDSIGSPNSFLGVRLNLNKTIAATPDPSLYVYSREKDHRMKMYRYNGTNNRRSKKFVFEQSFMHDSKFRPLRFVSVDNVGVFCMAHALNKESFVPIFTQFASADICEFVHGVILASSPTVNLWRNFDLCNLSNRGLYLLQRMRAGYGPLLHNPRFDASKQEFSDEEIQHGIYSYNIELDRWYPVPAMISHPRESCMTVLNNNMLCVIESRDDRKMVQAYDRREGRWQRKPNVLHHHTNAQSCLLDGNIYVRSPEYCERYDPIAAKWENVGGVRRYTHSEVLQLIPYNHQLWQFGEVDLYGHFLTSGFNHLIEVYDPRTACWSFAPGMDAFETMTRDSDEQVLEAVVW